jgi:DNA primase
MIPNDTVQQILAAADIVDVVGEFVELKKRGTSLMACCPFHGEKTPSFHVSQSKGIYKCFGCGKGGDAVRFIMDLERISYPEALRWLAKKYGIAIEEKVLSPAEIERFNEKESLFIALEYAQNYFHELLKNSEEGQSIGMSYFIERGFSMQVIDDFKLGYALEEADAFYKSAKNAGYSDEVLLKAGLVIQKDAGGMLDRFRGRVIFPIHNAMAKPIAFGARILKPNPKAAKYINSPETDIYVKGDIVYGIAQAKTEIKNKGVCYMVEGYTDVISLHQAGIFNVVASSGTSLTPNQVSLIKRYTKTMTVLYDGDWAGIKASLRGIDIILEADVDVKSVVFPDGDDPDSYIRKVGGEEFKTYIEKASKDFVQFKTELSLGDAGTDPIKRAGLIDDLVNTVIKIPNPLKRSVYYQEVSRLLQIDEAIIVTEATKRLSKAEATKKTNPTTKLVGEFGPVQEEQTATELGLDLKAGLDSVLLRRAEFEKVYVQMLLLYGQEVIGEEEGKAVFFADYLLAELHDVPFEDPINRLIWELYSLESQKNQLVDLKIFTSHIEEGIQRRAITLISNDHVLSPAWGKYKIDIPKSQEIVKEKFERILTSMLYEFVQFEISELQKKMEDISDENEIDQDLLFLEILKKNTFKRQLGDNLGIIV